MRELTDEDRVLAERVATLGPSALFDAGLSHEQSRDFMSKPEVRAELERLNQDFNHQDVIKALTRFGARRRLARLAPESVDLLSSALKGPMYEVRLVEHEDRMTGAVSRLEVVNRDGQGNPIILVPEPTRLQLKAATEILDRVGVTSGEKHDRLPNINLNVMLKQGDAASITIELDESLDTHEKRALSRERMRNAIESLKGGLARALDSEVVKDLNVTVRGVQQRKKKVAKRAPPKKVAKRAPPKKKTTIKRALSRKKTAKTAPPRKRRVPKAKTA